MWTWAWTRWSRWNPTRQLQVIQPSQPSQPASPASQESAKSPIPPGTDEEQGHEEGPGTSQAGPPQKKKTTRAKKSFVLTEAEEEELVEWIAEKEILWNSKLKDIRRTDKKGAMWEDRARAMSKTPELLQGCWQGIKNQNTKLHKKKSNNKEKHLSDIDFGPGQDAVIFFFIKRYCSVNIF
jgi:hypothetical protein